MSAFGSTNVAPGLSGTDAVPHAAKLVSWRSSAFFRESIISTDDTLTRLIFS